MKSEPGTASPTVAIIGAGFAGLTAAIKLARSGADVTIFERSSGAGGVWRANDYPGAACDVPSFLYSWSFAPKLDWSHKFARQAEILRYIDNTVDRFGIRQRIRFGMTVSSLDFDDDANEWTLSFTNGERHRAQIAVAALGQMSAPAIPALPGADSFTGGAFHTAEWRHDVDLAGKNIVVIGAGASALQVVPAIVESAGSIAIIQRSPGFVLGKDDEEYLAPRPAWRNRLDRIRGYIMKEVQTPRLVRWPGLVASAERTYHRNLREWVPDESLHAKVAPTDRYGCKRILVSNDWYRTLQNPRVQLHDSSVAAVSSDSVTLSDGTHLPADVLIYGTGFRATSFLDGIEVRGADGVTLDASWRRTPAAFLGMTIPGFPNLFLMYGPNTNPAWNSVLVMLEFQTRYICDAVRRFSQHGVLRMDVKRSTAAKFARQLATRSARSVWVTGCANWFTTADGINTQNWPSLVTEYWWRTRRVRWSDYNIHTATPRTEPLRSAAERVRG